MKDGKIVHPASRPILLLPTQTMKIAQVPICARDMFETCLFSPTKERQRERKKKNPLFLLRLVEVSEGRAFMQTRRRGERERFAQKRHFFWAATATHPLPPLHAHFLAVGNGRGRRSRACVPLASFSFSPTVRSQREAEEGEKGEGEIRCVDGSPSSSARRRRGLRGASFISCV